MTEGRAYSVPHLYPPFWWWSTLQKSSKGWTPSRIPVLDLWPSLRSVLDSAFARTVVRVKGRWENAGVGYISRRSLRSMRESLKIFYNQ